MKLCFNDGKEEKLYHLIAEDENLEKSDFWEDVIKSYDKFLANGYDENEIEVGVRFGYKADYLHQDQLKFV